MDTGVLYTFYKVSTSLKNDFAHHGKHFYFLWKCFYRLYDNYDCCLMYFFLLFHSTSTYIIWQNICSHVTITPICGPSPKCCHKACNFYFPLSELTGPNQLEHDNANTHNARPMNTWFGQVCSGLHRAQATNTQNSIWRNWNDIKTSDFLFLHHRAINIWLHKSYYAFGCGYNKSPKPGFKI